jgi:hypothetical protein
MPGIAGRIEAPLECVARDRQGPRDPAVGRDLGLRPNVDENGAVGTRGPRSQRIEPLQVATSLIEELMDRGPGDGRKVAARVAYLP